MASSLGLVGLGLALLLAGGELLVRGASGLALLARVTPTVVGLTVVAAGTSMPELVVSLQAALAGSPAIAAGNVVGSNIFNVGAVLGVAALVRPLRVMGSAVRLEWPVMLLSAAQFHLLARDGVIDRFEGAFLFTAMLAFTAYVVWFARRDAHATSLQEPGELQTLGHAGPRAWLMNLVAVGAGIGLLAAGSSALVEGSVALAQASGVPDVVIGLTLVAGGTSLPELAASLVAAYRGKDDIAIANVLGSNIFNVLAIVGVTSLVQPLPIASVIVERDDLWMLGVSLLLFPLMRSGLRITRTEGALLCAAFVGYLGALFLDTV